MTWPRSCADLKARLAELESRYAPGDLAEGIVFHHPDGRRAKIRLKEFINTELSAQQHSKIIKLR